MNTLAAVIFVLAATYSTSQASSFGFRAADFTRGYVPFLATCMTEGKHGAVFETFAVDFNVKGNTYLLVVSKGWMNNYPELSVQDDAPWYGNSTSIFFHAKATTTDFTVLFKATVGPVKDKTYQSTECSITAKVKGYIPATTNILAKDYAGSDYVFLYPADKWFLVAHTIDVESYGTWDISASCPGADISVVSELVNTVKKVELVKQRDVAHDIVRACSDIIFGNIDVANYITK